jgi:hypothetical protein
MFIGRWWQTRFVLKLKRERIHSSFYFLVEHVYDYAFCLLMNFIAGWKKDWNCGGSTWANATTQDFGFYAEVVWWQMFEFYDVDLKDFSIQGVYT